MSNFDNNLNSPFFNNTSFVFFFFFFIISINLKKKDGRWQNFMLSDTNNLGRVGFEQGKKLLNNLSDSEIIKYIKVEYPNYDFSQLQGY